MIKNFKRNLSKPKPNLKLFAIVTIFAAVSVFGLSLITGNNQQTNIGSSNASSTEPADINNDNKVDIFDLSILLSKWNTNDSTSDLNNDNIVNVFDLSILLSKWGAVTSTNNPPYSNAGAQLPISYDLATLTGTKRYVATNGNDSTGNGSISAPYATLAKAISVAANNDSIVIRGGTYRQGGVTVPSSKTLRIVAYPGETPVFNGAQQYASGWTTEGSLQYKSYTPMPVTNGSGISFTTGQNLTGDGVGKYPDQAWVGSTQLRQVTAKSSVTAGTFWVDSTNNRIYLLATDVAKGNIEVSSQRVFIALGSPNSVLEGIKITRFSNTASDYGVVKIYNTADGSKLVNVELSETAFIAMQYMGDSNLLNNASLTNVTITKSNWMGIGAVYTDNLLLDKVKITDMNSFDEFTHSPQSGALKTSRTRYTKVINSIINDNHSHGLWFDQSNVDIDVANNQIVNNLGTGLFFEISDDLLLINNYIKASGGARAVKLAGSSGLKLVNNTIIGGADTVGVYVDNRSIPGCADPSQPLCANSYSSDRDIVRSLPSTLDWMPRLDYMVNNIVINPTATGYCGTNVALCFTNSNGTSTVPIQTIIHKADVSRGIPQTYMNSNVYNSSSGRLIHTEVGYFTSISAFTTKMAGSPVYISGLESGGLYGSSYVNSDGSATSALNHSNATAVPNDSNINNYLQAGTKHYGVTY